MEKINSQLEKASEFRYFALLATFVFFLDFNLVVFQGSQISALSYKAIADDYNLGQVVVFFTLFTFFMSFVVPLVQLILKSFSFLVPYKWSSFFFEDQWKDIQPKDYFYLFQLERYAVRKSDAVAYEYYKSLLLGRKREHELEFYCLAFILSIFLNFYAYHLNDKALFSWFIPLFSDEQVSIAGRMFSIVLWILFLFSCYFGVIRGGGFSQAVSDKFHFPDNNFRND